jgi:hypothetical protein
LEMWLALLFCLGNGSPCAAIPVEPAFDRADKVVRLNARGA